jgi:hypothetical protein
VQSATDEGGLTPKPERTKHSKHESIALRCLTRAMTASGILMVVGDGTSERMAVHVEEWRKSFYLEGMPGEQQDTKKKTFARARSSLIEKGTVQAFGDYVWLVN